MKATAEQLRARTIARADALEFVPCAVCGAGESTYLHRKASPEGEVFPIVRCTACGLVYVNPRPRPDTLAELYRSRYFETGDDAASGYVDYIRDRDLHTLFFDRQLDAIERRVPRRGHLLDVGCATGFLLAEARRRGWQATGVDLSTFASEYARREFHLDVRSATLREAAFPGGHFDAVVMDDLIEHVGDPAAELQEVHRVLAPGGVLLVHTPNADSPWYALMRRYWVHLKAPEHLYYFSPATLAALLRTVGFARVETRPSGKPTHLEYVAGRVKIYHVVAGRVLERLVKRLPFARRPFPLRTGEMETLAVKA